jgi:hypothetical protein
MASTLSRLEGCSLGIFSLPHWSRKASLLFNEYLDSFSRKELSEGGFKKQPTPSVAEVKFEQSYVSIYSPLPTVPSYHISGSYLFKILLFKIKLC